MKKKHNTNNNDINNNNNNSISRDLRRGWFRRGWFQNTLFRLKQHGERHYFNTDTTCNNMFFETTPFETTPYASPKLRGGRGVQWKQGVVNYMTLYTSLL